MGSSKLQQHQPVPNPLALTTARTVAVALAKTTAPGLLIRHHRPFPLRLPATVRTSHLLVPLAVIGLSFSLSFLLIYNPLFAAYS